jgi:hypothetical protein
MPVNATFVRLGRPKMLIDPLQDEVKINQTAPCFRGNSAHGSISFHAVCVRSVKRG